MTRDKKKPPQSINVYVRDIASDVQDGLYQVDPTLPTPENIGMIVSAIIKADILVRYDDVLDGEKFFVNENNIRTKFYGGWDDVTRGAIG